MSEAVDNTNQLTGKPRKISDGSKLGDATEAFHAATSRVDRKKLLLAHPALQRHFRIDDFADVKIDEAPAT